MIKAGKDPSWADTGHDKFLTHSLSPADPNYMTTEDMAQNTQTAALRSSTVGGNLLVKRLIVNDLVNDRVLIGKFNA